MTRRDCSFSMMLAAGGTGGHVLPAVAFGRWLNREKPGVNVSYMSGSRAIELEIYKAFGIKPFVLKTSGSPMGVPGIRRIKRFAELAVSFLQANDFMKKTSTDICVLFGGYISIPALFAGKVRGIRSLLHEQNALAGRVTRIAAHLRIPIASGWENCEPLSGSRYTHVGVPIRRLENVEKDEARRLLGLNDSDGRRPVVTVMAGSLGSGKISGILSELTVLDCFSSWKFLIIDSGVDVSRNPSKNVTQMPKMWDISALYAASDVMITRGGASTLSEIAALGIPSVVVPWRKASDDHQMKNALAALSEKIEIWDEEKDSLMDLSDKLQKLYAKYCGENGDSDNLLYNACEVGEKNCRRLWEFIADFMRGDVGFGN
ncbi:MAG: UDP-N-acetylglucosamine--N-acetylmuramyl-(pentapeptide) pyrophosphoryl-undecaprenol N-acetylglucosamine transferase [Synergistaceae bacterium]|nr:UDP-N-acetylglucosamine--N-acetylmuramyl-(pentapeptide) pyrophosphoryl-undecaprenol N-acetylglucosamine transferase [Synergistaceae bacterium]